MGIRVGKESSTVAVLLVLLCAVNVSQLFVSWTYSWVIVALFSCLLLFIALRSGLTLSDIGLGRHAILKGLLWGFGAVVAVIVCTLAAFEVKPDLFIDSRYHNSLGQALFSALVIIPLHTVLAEELAFRGVLWACLRRINGVRFATLTSSLLFGFWHIVPSLGIGASDGVLGDASTGIVAGRVLIIATIVVVTTLAGIALCELRRRSDSLVAPILAHWAINGVAVILAALALSISE